MTLKARHFTPEVLLSAPRRDAGIPNADGSLVLCRVTTYSFASHENTVELRCLDPKTNASHLVTKDEKVSNPVWLEGNTIVVLRAKNDGSTELVVSDVKTFEHSYVAGVIQGPADNLKITRLGDKHFGLAFSAAASPDGTIYNPEKVPTPVTTGKLYRSLFVRHWDTWLQPARQAIFFTALVSKSDDGNAKDGALGYSMSTPRNVLKGTGLESPIPPDGGLDHFDISKSGIVFVAKDPVLNHALHTKCRLYFTTLETFLEETCQLSTVDVGDYKGAMTSPRFSRDGEKIAFLVMRQDGYESDKNQVFVIPDTKRPAWLVHYMPGEDGNGSWDRSPSSVEWSHDGSKLYLAADDSGRKALFSLSAPMKKGELPQPLPGNGSVTAITVLAGGNIFVSGSSLVDSSFYYAIDPKEHTIYEFPGILDGGKTVGLSEAQISQLWIPGAGKNPSTNDQVHAWIMLPSNFSPMAKNYPMAFLVHGGPQGAWGNAWSTRWNAAVFAEQGYVVVCPNPTGSTGYGQAFTDAIQRQWGGLPYEDLVNCFDYVEKNLPYVDISRSVMLGASYGGFMCNWIQGHPLGRRFKALVCHDGVFSTAYEVSTDELYFANREFGGPYHDPSVRHEWHKWDPSLHTENWATPQLVIHSDKDFRLTMTDGLAAFNVLQSKGIESEFLTFPDENHFVLNPENSLVWHSVVLSFINKHVGLPEYRPDVVKGVVMDPPRPAAEESQEVKVVEK